MNRRTFLKSTAMLGVGSFARPFLANAAAREIIVAEPVHGLGYLPLYVGRATG